MGRVANRPPIQHREACQKMSVLVRNPGYPCISTRSGNTRDPHTIIRSTRDPHTIIKEHQGSPHHHWGALGICTPSLGGTKNPHTLIGKHQRSPHHHWGAAGIPTPSSGSTRDSHTINSAPTVHSAVMSAQDM